MRALAYRSLVIAALGLAARSAGAAEPNESGPGRAAALFREGRALLAQGRFDLACERFAESRAAEPTIGALLNIADCDERNGKLVSARAACLEAHDLAVARQDAERATFAETRAREIDERTPRVRIVTTPDEGARPRVTRDDAPVADATLGRSIAVDPGTHVIVAEAAGREPYRHAISLNAGDAPLTVTIPKLARTVSAPAAVEPTSTRSTTGALVAGGGGVIVLAGVITGALAFSRWHDALASCPLQQCPNASSREIADHAKDEASTFALASTIGFVVGTLILAGGLYVYVSSGEPRRKSVAGLSF